MHNQLLKSLIGTWEGECRTWFHPGRLADESRIAGEFRPILGNRLVRHTYTGQLQGKPRTGEELLAFHAAMKEYQVAWIDDFHMNDGILFSSGHETETGFSVTGSYGVAPDAPRWHWKTVYDRADDHHLTITAYNISPDGDEAKAVETILVKAAS